MKLTNGTLVVVRGRVQMEAQIGLIIVAEQLAILGQSVLNEIGG
jgi:hypothetical protein